MGEKIILSPLLMIFHIYLLQDKHQPVDMFEVYIKEVERQLDEKVKRVSQIEVSNYNNYNESRCPDPFVKFLRKMVFVLNTQ